MTESRQVETLLNRTFEIIASGVFTATKDANQTIGFGGTTDPLPGDAPFATLLYIDDGVSQWYQVPFTAIDSASGAVNLLVESFSSVNGGVGSISILIRTPSGGAFYSQALSYEVRYFALRERVS